MSATTTPPRPGFIDFKAIKKAVSIQQVLEKYNLIESFTQTSEDRLSGKCPIHGGTNPTQFRVSLSKNCFNCFGKCHGGGNVLDFVAKMEDLPIREAALKLVEWFDLDTGQASPKSYAKPKDEDPHLNHPLNFTLKTLKSDHPYLQERGLSPETIEEFGLGFCSRGMLKDRIAIPIHNAHGQLIAYAGRHPSPDEDEPKYKFPKGFKKSLELYNFHRAKAEAEEFESGSLVLVEGFFDCHVMWQAGVTNCVALMGSVLTENQLTLLREHFPEDTVMELLLDDDEAGQHALEVIETQLSVHFETRILKLPEGVSQPDQLSEEQVLELFE